MDLKTESQFRQELSVLWKMLDVHVTENTHQADLLREALEVMKLYDDAIPSPEAQALIPRIEAALEGK